MDVGANIREARKIVGLTQADVAEMAGISINSLRLYEGGKRTPNLEQLQYIAGAIGVEWTSLVDGDFVWVDEYTLLHEAKPEVYKKLIENIQRHHGSQARANKAMEQMTEEGRSKVADYAEDILPRYRRQDPAQPPAEAAPAQDTPTPPDAPEGPQKPKEGV